MVFNLKMNHPNISAKKKKQMGREKGIYMEQSFCIKSDVNERTFFDPHGLEWKELGNCLERASVSGKTSLRIVTCPSP